MHFLYEYDQEEHMRQIREEAWHDGFEEGIQQAKLNSIKSIMKTIHISVEKAMEVLEISRDKQAEYLSLLQK